MSKRELNMILYERKKKKKKMDTIGPYCQFVVAFLEHFGPIGSGPKNAYFFKNQFSKNDLITL